MLARQVEHGVAEGAADFALGRDEVGRARRIQDVLVGGVFAFGGVAVDQRFGGVARQHQLQLPGQVLGVLHAAIGAARAERRDAVGRIAGEHHAPMAEMVHALAGEGVDAHPLQFEVGVRAQQGADARQHVLGLDGLDRVGVPAQLEIDAPDIVGLHVQQDRLIGVEGRVEPEPALSGIIGRHLHVGDQEAVLEYPAMGFQVQQLAHRRARAVAGDQPVGMQGVGAVGRVDRDLHAIGLLRHAHHLAFPAQLDARLGAGQFVQVALGVILLQVDEGRAPVPGLGQQVEAPDFLVAEEHLADVPRYALVDHALAHAQAVPDLQRALGEADGARAGRQAVVVIQHHDPQALPRQVQRRGQAHRARAHHDHTVPGRRVALLVGAFRIGELDRLVVDVSHDCLLRGGYVLVFCSCRARGRRKGRRPGPSMRRGDQPSSCCHISMSRLSVQMRGS
ncbi:Uncharacterised protein [Bordetella pertussis]|nr:Uncharacterised protein [Bordetella pertussis]CFM15594.1 Uncharacterised protein [Bordetella pertussis]CFM32097.1 Uncharacterised protein [Bordetella pertussis]CFM33080.1 Uncharacterised protein [Bordetella pertussis]CFM44857.1 Uncharacterised protein [Bordetella pertussis]